VQRYWRSGAPLPQAVVETEWGTVTLELYAAEAPLVVEAFTRLAREGKYRNTVFHRVVPNFVVQDGDIANGDGPPEPPFTLRESWTRRRHGRGCLGLATAGPDTGGSQFYLCHSTQPHLDGGYTVFGRVIQGFDVMDRLAQGDRMIQVRVP
jgi:cyclophilin family peptidyl-prolyl cis-trans isomerase